MSAAAAAIAVVVTATIVIVANENENNHEQEPAAPTAVAAKQITQTHFKVPPFPVGTNNICPYRDVGSAFRQFKTGQGEYTQRLEKSAVSRL